MLSPVLSALYLSLLFHIFEEWLKHLKIPIYILSVLDNELFIAQNKFLVVSNLNLFCSYHIMISLLKKFGLIIKHGRFLFFQITWCFWSSSTRSHNIKRSHSLTQQYMAVFGVHFWQYVDFYTNKVISTIKCMKMLGNSSRSLIPTQKRLLYRCCVLPITLYDFQI